MAAIARGRADLRDCGAPGGIPGWPHAGCAVLGDARRIAVDRNDPDVFVDERFPFGAMAEAAHQLARRRIPQDAHEWCFMRLAA